MFNQKKLQQEEQIMNKFLNKYQRRHFFQYDTPMTISFLLTNKCNLRCKHCFNNTEKKMEDELNVEDYDKLASSMGFVASGLFCGGEPYLRSDLADIINIFKEKCNMQFCSTTTNGTLTDSILEQTEKIVSIDRRKRFVLNFSLDGYENEHDLTRGKGTYKRCIESLKEANKLKKKFSNLQIGIVSTMTTINENILSDFFEYISDKYEPNVISLLKVRQSPRIGEYIKEISIENYRQAKETLNKLFVNEKNGNIDSPVGYYPLAFYDIIEKTMRSNMREFYCYAGTHGAYIDYNGDVNACEILGDYNCTSHPFLMGNLKDYNMNFINLWNSEQAQIVRNTINRNKCCEKCTHETEGILPSIYFEPNAIFYKERIKKVIENYGK